MMTKASTASDALSHSKVPAQVREFSRASKTVIFLGLVTSCFSSNGKNISSEKSVGTLKKYTVFPGGFSRFFDAACGVRKRLALLSR